MERRPVVSIICMVFNHAKFLTDTLDGFVKQKTDFQFEIIVHDDASTDNSAEIIREYQTKFPCLFKPILQTENQYSLERGRVTRICYGAAKGKYIALCEGDDFWTDSFKLQKQVNFLESNEDYGLVHTDYNIITEEGDPVGKISKRLKSGEVFDLLFNGHYNIVTATVLFRRNFIQSFCGNPNFQMGDLPLWLEISFNSKIKYINLNTATYRILKNSASHSDNWENVFSFTLNTQDIYKDFAKRNGLNFHEKKRLANVYSSLIKEAYIKKDKEKANEFYSKFINIEKFYFLKFRPLLWFLGTKNKIVAWIIELVYKNNKW